jgi:hypothetical protein
MADEVSWWKRALGPWYGPVAFFGMIASGILVSALSEPAKAAAPGLIARAVRLASYPVPGWSVAMGTVAFLAAHLLAGPAARRQAREWRRLHAASERLRESQVAEVEHLRAMVDAIGDSEDRDAMIGRLADQWEDLAGTLATAARDEADEAFASLRAAFLENRDNTADAFEKILDDSDFPGLILAPRGYARRLAYHGCRVYRDCMSACDSIMVVALMGSLLGRDKIVR